jgi:diguanylate cyclase (GGDEF)-like protein/PAS domain S-box-containing protein
MSRPLFEPNSAIAGVPSVLLVNDNAGTLYALRAILGDLDVQVVTATSGKQALMRLLKQDFVAIVLDVKMAGMDGFDTARLIRARPRSQATPIIFLTSHRATDLDQAAGYALGAADYLFMPVAPDLLKAKIQAFIDAWQTRDSGAAVPVALPPQVVRSADPGPMLVEHSGEYVALVGPDGAWRYAGKHYQQQFGLTLQPGGSYLALVHQDDRRRVSAAFQTMALLEDGERPRRLQYRVLQHQERHFETDGSPIRDVQGCVTQLMLVSRDVTERKEMERYVLHQSSHDALTGLPNRMLLADRLSQVTARSERLHISVALLFVDLDHFKDVNDTLGHAAGDRLLQDMAERITGCVRDGDTVARLGGDEFVIMLLGLHDTQSAALVAEKIVAAVSVPCHIEGSELHVTPSIGIAIFPDDGIDPDTLLRNADTAMYHAKREGGARFSFFAPQMQEAASRKLALGAALQRAIGAGEFRMHYQPKVHARSGAISGFEALIRWPRDDAEWIGPSVFIPIAEESGRIEPIGRWALREATRELQRWRDLGFDAVPIAVNMSALQLRREDVAVNLDAVVREAGIMPGMLEVELTETGLMSNPALAVQILQQIHALGFRISIDDFGTGYSSLSYLRRLPIDKLKIDASFVRDIASDPSDAAIVKAIITLGHILNLTIIAEGVETAEQVAFLVEQGCDEMQGYYFSAAVSNDCAIDLLRRGPFAIGTAPPWSR